MSDPDVIKIFKKTLADERIFAQAWVADVNSERRMCSGRFEKVLTMW